MIKFNTVTSRISILIIWPFLLLGFAIHLATANNTDNTLLSRLEAELNSPKWQDRMAAARDLPSGNSNVSMESQILIDALQHEILDPISSEFHSGSYVNITDALKREYIFALVRYGAEIIPFIKSYWDTDDQRLKDLKIIVLGFLGDTAIVNTLRGQIPLIESGDSRALAVGALAQHYEINDTTLFMKLLMDPYKVTTTTDHIKADGKFIIDYFPVREEAATGLRKHGFIVMPDSTGKFEIIRGR